jgi:hypothetical protein
MLFPDEAALRVESDARPACWRTTLDKLKRIQLVQAADAAFRTTRTTNEL